jgi:hypothetical protein
MADLTDLPAVPGLDTPPGTRDGDATDEERLLFSDAVCPSHPGTPADDLGFEIAPWHGRTTPDFYPAPGMRPAPADAGFLARLPMLDPVAQHSATLVMQALQAFPRMMLRKPTFPPFIHPSCHRYPLPEPLALCMGIAHVFVSPSVETRSFLWQSVEREQLRLVDQASNLEEDIKHGNMFC